MPASALANVAVDHCLPLEGIPAVLRQLVAGMPSGGAAMPLPARLLKEQAVFEGKGADSVQQLSSLGSQSSITCPECGGSLWEIEQQRPLRYRCHTGHAFSARSLENAQAEVLDQSLVSSFRLLRERELLLRRLASVAEATGDRAQAEVGRRAADRVAEQAQTLQRLISGGAPAHNGPEV